MHMNVAQKVSEVACYLYLHYHRIMLVMLIISTSGKIGKIGNCFECLPLVRNVSYYRILDFKWFGNGRTNLPRLMAATISSLRSLLMSFLLGIVWLAKLLLPDDFFYYVLICKTFFYHMTLHQYVSPLSSPFVSILKTLPSNIIFSVLLQLPVSFPDFPHTYW